MKAQQPNFETFKKILLQYIIKNENFRLLSLGGEFKQFHKKEEENIKELNIFLDRLDIRAVNKIIDDNKYFITFPSWLYNKKFIIDYNKNGFLDLIKI